MKSSEYWQNRFKAIEEMNNKDAKKTVDAVTPAFDKALAQIENKINAWYQRFADNEGVSLAEAKRLLNTKELKEFKWDVQEYIKYGRENSFTKEWMTELENASARYHISRLEALKIHTQNAAEVAFGNELDQIDEMAARVYTNDYYHTAYEIQKGIGVGFDVGQIDQRKLDKIIKKPWTADGQTFSDRIWKSKKQLVDSVHTELTQMCILGKAPDQAIKNISRKMNVSKNQAGRLIMTEAAYFSSAAQKDCFNDLDVEKYEVVATLDSHTSDICQSMDGKVFDMKDFKEGVTAPPFHVWCRSCTVPWFEDNNDGSRAARDADGKTYQVPASMTYKDWKDYFVDKTKDPADWLKPATVEDIVNAVKEFVPAKSISEAEEFAKANFADSVDYKGFSLKRVNEINEKLYDLFAKHPSVNRYETIDQKVLKGCVASANGTSLSFNKGKAKLNQEPFYEMKAQNEVDIERLKKVIETGLEDGKSVSKFRLKLVQETIDKKLAYNRYGRFNVGKTQSDIIAHEFGHTLAKQKTGDFIHHTPYQRLNEKNKMIYDTFEKAKGNGDIYSLSTYGATNADEFFAECFCANDLGESLPQYILEMLRFVEG